MIFKPIKRHNSISTILSIVLAINGVCTKPQNFIIGMLIDHWELDLLWPLLDYLLCAEDGLGFICMGELYMLGSRLGLNGADSLPALCSERTWCVKKLHSPSVLGGQWELSCVVGYSSNLSGHGQKLSRRLVMTDWQNRGLGWLSKSLLNMLTWIKQVVLKRLGFSKMVFSEVSVKAEGGGLGRGSAIREYIAVSPICSTSASQISCRANRGQCPLHSSASNFSLRAVTLAVWSSTDLQMCRYLQDDDFSGICHHFIVGMGRSVSKWFQLQISRLLSAWV